jgi:hypothetical protein
MNSKLGTFLKLSMVIVNYNYHEKFKNNLMRVLLLAISYSNMIYIFLYSRCSIVGVSICEICKLF